MLRANSLYVKVCLTNGLVLGAAVLVLMLTPASVSSQVSPAQAVLLVGGLLLVVAVTALLLRSALAPVDRVIDEMATVRLGGIGQRLDDTGSGPGAQLVSSYHAMLDRLEAERRTSSARVLAAQEAERHRIARELHDEIGQSLTVVLLGLQHLEQRVPADLVAELAELRESARAGLDDVRRVARELRPGVLEDLGLQAAIAALATDAAARGGPTVRRTFAPGLPSLGPDAEIVVYRVAQEALTNVVRHAGARSVEVSLCRVGEAVELEVRDDGRGFDVRAVDGADESVGLAGMRDRAALVGGAVEVVSGAGGTSVRLRVPVEAVPVEAVAP